MLTLVLLNCLFIFFIHLKLESLTQFPALNDENMFFLMSLIYDNNPSAAEFFVYIYINFKL